jgi:hypothetical protein
MCGKCECVIAILKLFFAQKTMMFHIPPYYI